MTRRIFRSICVVALAVFLASVVLFMGVLYNYFSRVQRSQLRMQTALAAQGVDHEGLNYFTDLDAEDYRITWIDTDGTVRFDSRSDTTGMENHLEREEIQQAFAEGAGESARYSVTLLERSFYCARRLSDGTVLRLSVAQSSLLTLLLGMLQPLVMIFFVALVLSLILAYRLSKRIVKPLNALDLNAPMQNEGYDEIAPLLRRIAAQQRQIRQQADELQQQQSEFMAVTTGMAEGIVLLNGRQQILSINPAAARLFDTDASCEGNELQSVNRSSELQALLQKAGEGEHVETILELGGGHYQIDASPVYAEGLISGFVLLLLDVTEKEKLEQLRREFTANVSHELKTPLQTISGSAELLANGLVQAKDVPHFSRQIYTEAQRMIRLVEDILKLSRLDEGVGDWKREPVDLYALAEETLRALRPAAGASGVQCELRGASAVISSVKQLVEAILYNLCDNAIKYNHPDGRVVVEVADGEHGARVSVADTGIGIPAEHQERIFERFYRVDKSHSREIGGTGLGLSIVKHAALRLGATIELQSVVEKGTTVTVHFPKCGE